MTVERGETIANPSSAVAGGLDLLVRRWATPVALTAVVCLAGLSVFRATQGQKPGDAGGLLVLTIVTAMGLKLVAETYLFAQIGGDPSPRQSAAKRLVGPLARWTTVRYLLGGFGGVIFPLASQLLAAGAKNIPPAVDPAPAAVAACLAAACLIPGELLERRLCRLTLGAGESGE